MDTILPVIKEADALVLQLEIPYESVISLIEYAHTVDTKIILNPAPAKQIPSYILEKVDILILNETEAMLIAGQSLDFSVTDRYCSKSIEKSRTSRNSDIGRKGVGYCFG